MVNIELDKISWKGAAGAIFSILDTYKMLILGTTTLFFVKGPWVPSAPTKTIFFAWEVAWVKVLILDKLQKSG